MSVWGALLSSRKLCLDARHVAGGVEPGAGAELAAQEEQRAVGQLADLEDGAPAPPVRGGKNRQKIDRVEQAAGETVVTGGDEGQMHFPTIETGSGRRMAPSSTRCTSTPG